MTIWAVATSVLFATYLLNLKKSVLIHVCPLNFELHYEYSHSLPEYMEQYVFKNIEDHQLLLFLQTFTMANSMSTGADVGRDIVIEKDKITNSPAAFKQHPTPMTDRTRQEQLHLISFEPRGNVGCSLA